MLQHFFTVPTVSLCEYIIFFFFQIIPKNFTRRPIGERQLMFTIFVAHPPILQSCTSTKNLQFCYFEDFVCLQIFVLLLSIPWSHVQLLVQWVSQQSEQVSHFRLSIQLFTFSDGLVSTVLSVFLSFVKTRSNSGFYF